MYQLVFDCNSVVTAQALDGIVQVYAARKGIQKGNNDMTCFVLIVRLANTQRIKILETKNATKIRKELICVRKFLGLDDQELAIYDETRKDEGSKTDNRYRGKPSQKQLINSKGERMVDSEEEEPETIELVAPRQPATRKQPLQLPKRD